MDRRSLRLPGGIEKTPTRLRGALELPLEESLLGREYLADSLQLVPQLLPD